MPQVTVFNTTNGPVYVDNARCIGGYETVTLEPTQAVHDYITKGVLLDKTSPRPPKPSEPAPVAEVVDPPSIDDGSDDVPPVSSEVEDASDEPVDDATETQPKPASMKRRRKTPPVKE